MIQRLALIWAAITLLGVIALAVALTILWSHGFGSRSEPSNMESSIAMKVLDSSVPAKYEKMSSPLSVDTINLIEAGGLYQQQCAVCHADNGSGDPKFHGIMSPRPTDLRSEDTQEMSDGELYWVIKNGIRWSGMPAFGDPGDGDERAWKMVAYVRHLPKLTPAEAQQVLQQSEGPIDHGPR
jgi:mono/diheme cytochrome c family protein